VPNGYPDPVLTAPECGRACAVAAAGQRELRRHAAGYPDLFPDRLFGGAFFATLALAGAFTAPSCDPVALGATNLAGLFVFALDWQVEVQTSEAALATDVVDPVLAVAGGAVPAKDTSLSRLLTELRGQVRTAPGYPLWRAALVATATAMVREWRWRSGSDEPPRTLPGYLDNADSTGFLFVYATHWIATDPYCPEHVAGLRAAGLAAQRILRLVNDLGTAARERSIGDVNALTLGATPDAVAANVRGLLDGYRRLAEPVRDHHAHLAAFLDRQIGFNEGLYQLGDYWSVP
jgi:Terpene synthase family 2, C-terminal metal binding